MKKIRVVLKVLIILIFTASMGCTDYNHRITEMEHSSLRSPQVLGEILE